MPDPIITPNNLGDSILQNAEFRDEQLTFVGAGTVLAGTILARDSVSGNMVPYVIGGVANGNGIPKGLLTYDVVSAGAGNVPIRSAVTGRFRREALIVDADGDGSNITNAIIDELRVYDILPIDVAEGYILDNS